MSTGFVANYTLFTTLAQRGDAIVFDEWIHASAKEGIHASHARRYKARHNDAASFAEAAWRAKRRGARQIWITVESVYSMDGDLAPLPELVALAEDIDAILIVDEAHATGIFGPRGRGLSEGCEGERLITLHTCGKALGRCRGARLRPRRGDRLPDQRRAALHLFHRAAAAGGRGGETGVGADRRGAVATAAPARARCVRQGEAPRGARADAPVSGQSDPAGRPRQRRPRRRRGRRVAAGRLRRPGDPAADGAGRHLAAEAHHQCPAHRRRHRWA